MTLPQLPTLTLLILLFTGGPLPPGPRPAAEPHEADRASVPVDEDARAEALWIYQTRCAHCHGLTGRGDGEDAEGLDPAPADFSRLDGMGAHDRGYIEMIILSGGPAVRRSPAMPANPDLKGKPDVVVALRDIVTALGDVQGGR